MIQATADFPIEALEVALRCRVRTIASDVDDMDEYPPRHGLTIAMIDNCFVCFGNFSIFSTLICRENSYFGKRRAEWPETRRCAIQVSIYSISSYVLAFE